MPEAITVEEFKTRFAQKKLNHIKCLNIEKYQKYSKTLLTFKCEIHNTTYQTTPFKVIHSLNGGCKKCRCFNDAEKKRKSFETVIKKANEIHNNEYDYSKYVYVNNKTNGEIYHPKCGKFFLQRMDAHLFNKTGCPFCRRAQIYTKAYYLAKGIPNHDCYFYVVEFESKDKMENFIKIGLTKHEGIRKRFRGKSEYVLKNVYSIETDFFTAYDFEQKLLLKYRQNSYLPIHSIKGRTECLSKDVYNSIMTDIKENSLFN